MKFHNKCHHNTKTKEILKTLKQDSKVVFASRDVSEKLVVAAAGRGNITAADYDQQSSSTTREGIYYKKCTSNEESDVSTTLVVACFETRGD